MSKEGDGESLLSRSMSGHGFQAVGWKHRGVKHKHQFNIYNRVQETKHRRFVRMIALQLPKV